MATTKIRLLPQPEIKGNVREEKEDPEAQRVVAEVLNSSLTPSEVPMDTPVEDSVVSTGWDLVVLRLYARGLKWTEISRATGWKIGRIKAFVRRPEFQEILKAMKGEITEVIVDEVKDSHKSALEMRKDALRALKEELDEGSSPAKIASAKVLLEEAARERAIGEDRKPITLDEIRRMSKDEARKLTQGLQAKG